MEIEAPLLSQQTSFEVCVILSGAVSHSVLECYQGTPMAARAPGALVGEAEEVARGGEGVYVEEYSIEKAATLSAARRVHILFPWKLDPTDNLCFLPTDSCLGFGWEALVL